MYKIAICDDDNTQVSILEQQVSSILDSMNVQYEIDAYFQGNRLVKSMESHHETYQLIFLDIEMEDLNGIDTARLLRSIDSNFILIYVTSYEQYALESFEVLPFRYLIKPVSDMKLQKVIDDILVELSTKQKYLFYKNGVEHFQVKLEDILFLYSELGRKIHVELVNGSHVSFYGKVSVIEEQLPGAYFVRVNSGTIVNMNYIHLFSKDEIILTSGEHISISRSRKQSVNSIYNKFIERSFGM